MPHLRRALREDGLDAAGDEQFLDRVEQYFRLEQFLEQLADLRSTSSAFADDPKFKGRGKDIVEALDGVFARIREEAPALYAPGGERKSDFFRDIAGSQYLTAAENVANEAKLPFDLMINLYDKSIISVENRPPDDDLTGNFTRALEICLRETTGDGMETDDGAAAAKAVTP